MVSSSSSSTRPKVLVTGACGYSGRAMVRALCDAGLYTVIAGDIHPPSTGGGGGKLEPLDTRAIFVRLDITNASNVTSVIQGVHSVFHFGALVPYNLSKAFGRAELERVNVQGTQTLIGSALQAGVKNFLVCSSTGVVFAGEDIRRGNETLPSTGPWNDDYSESKAKAERIVLEASDTSGSFSRMCCVAIRPNGIMGPAEAHHTPKLLKMARLGTASFMAIEPNSLTDFTSRKNLIHAFLLAHEKLDSGNLQDRKRVSGQAYFVTDPWAAHTVEFFSPLLAELGFAAPFPSMIVPKGTCGYTESQRLTKAEYNDLLRKKKSINSSPLAAAFLTSSPQATTVTAVTSITSLSTQSDTGLLLSSPTASSTLRRRGSRMELTTTTTSSSSKGGGAMSSSMTSSSSSSGKASVGKKTRQRQHGEEEEDGEDNDDTLISLLFSMLTLSGFFAQGRREISASSLSSSPSSSLSSSREGNDTKKSHLLTSSAASSSDDDDDEIILTGPAYYPLPGITLYPAALVMEALCSLIRPVYNVEPFLTVADARKVVRHNYYSSDRISRELGYTPVQSSASMLREMISYYKEAGYDGHVESPGLLPWIIAPPGVFITGLLGYDVYNVLTNTLKTLQEYSPETYANLTKGVVECANAILIRANNDDDHYYTSFPKLAGEFIQVIFWAATVCHIIQGLVVFQAAWSRFMAAGPWGVQSFFLGFASTSRFYMQVQRNEKQNKRRGLGAGKKAPSYDDDELMQEDEEAQVQTLGNKVRVFCMLGFMLCVPIVVLWRFIWAKYEA